MSKSNRKRSATGPDPESRERLAKAAEELLDRLPVEDPGSVFESVSRTVPGLEEELIDLLAGWPSPNIPAFLMNLATLPLSKKVLKGVRRALYRLEQAGFIDSEEARPKGASILRKPEERVPTAYLSGYDPDGARMGLLAVPAVAGGYDTALFVVHDREGLTEFLGMHLTGGSVRRMLRDLGQEFVAPPVAMPPGVVRFLLNEAAALSRQLKRLVPEDYDEFAGLAAVVAPMAGPVIYRFLKADEVMERVNLAERGPLLLAHETMLSLLFYDEVIPYLEQMKEAESSVLVLTDDQKEERHLAIVDKAAREIVTGDRKGFFKHQLEEVALYLWQSGEAELAETALAAALDLDRVAPPEADYSFAREAVRLTFQAGFQFMQHENEAGGGAGDVQEASPGLILPGRMPD